MGQTCRLLSGDVKRPIESLTPKLRDPSEGRLRRYARLGGHKQQRQHQLMSDNHQITGGIQKKFQRQNPLCLE